MGVEEPMDYDVLDGPLPRYQGNAVVVINGKPVDLNALQNPFNSTANVNDKTYDSRPDTLKHINEVRALLADVINELHGRQANHDLSKLEEPELSMFDVYRRKLDEVEHGSPEYKQHLVDMGEALQHHYRCNRHHPEHFKNGIRGMNLIDLIEMLCDWVAASGRQGDDVTPYITGGARERFGYGDELESLLLNTARYLDLGKG